MPPHETYIEAFAGMASVFFAKPKARINVVNDLNANIVNLFEVVRDNPNELIRLIELTPFAQDQLEKWSNLYLKQKDEFYKLPPVKRALIFFYVLRNSFNSQYTTNKNEYILSYTSAGTWANRAFLENIYAVSKFIQGVIFTNLPYQKCIERYSDNKTVVYLDPPYTMAEEGKYYEHNFSNEQHVELRDFVRDFSAKVGTKFIISYDYSEYISQLFSDGFFITEIKDYAQGMSVVEEGEEKVRKHELLITTFNPLHTGLFSEINK